jgi:hypothetical protein
MDSLASRLMVEAKMAMIQFFPKGPKTEQINLSRHVDLGQKML